MAFMGGRRKGSIPVTLNKAHFHKKSVSVRRLNYLMAIIMLVISVLLLFATVRAHSGYNAMRRHTDEYINWQREAFELQRASDYLTEQVRCFAQTGKREYLDNYFEEAKVSRHRDKALESVRQFMGETEAYTALVAAMNESVALMDREYYSMRLTIAAKGYDISEFPEEVQQTELTEEDALLSPEMQTERAREMVFDDMYHMKKEAITENSSECLLELASEIDARQEQTEDELNNILNRQRFLIMVAILVSGLTMILTLLLVISPLLRAVVYIRDDEPIPVKGSCEFQFLARTYNLMYEANREQKEQLAFDATHDSLTGIYNRSGYDFFLKNADWTTSALVLFDVDKFKQVNDNFGHETGDKVLARVAEILKGSFRSQDYVCRIGGDEFAVIMVHATNAPRELLHSKVERINQLLKNPGGDMPAVHVSCGAAYGTGGDDVEETFRQADAALYRIKSAGGCGCEVCPE